MDINNSNKAVPIENEKYFFRDLNSKGLLNVDVRGLQAYKREKDKRNAETQLILQYRKDINTLKEEVTDIKNSIKEILNKLNSIG